MRDYSGRGDPVQATTPAPDPPDGEETLEHLHRILRATSVEAAWKLHVAMMARYGFDRLLYAFTPFLLPGRVPELEDVMILSTHSEAYLAGYIGGGHYQHSLMLDWAMHNSGACSWGLRERIASARPLSLSERRTLNFNRSMGVTAGYLVSFPETSTRTRAALSLCARPGLDQAAVDALWQRHQRALDILTTAMHLRLSTLPCATPRRRLTPRQREVLEWSSEGKTTQDIATLMGVTVGTVEKHLRLARETMGVDTTTQAVLKAASLRQIFPGSPNAAAGDPQDPPLSPAEERKSLER